MDFYYSPYCTQPKNCLRPIFSVRARRNRIARSLAIASTASVARDEFVSLGGTDQAQRQTEISRRQFDDDAFVRLDNTALFQVLDKRDGGLDLDRAGDVEAFQFQKTSWPPANFGRR